MPINKKMTTVTPTMSILRICLFSLSEMLIEVGSRTCVYRGGDCGACILTSPSVLYFIKKFTKI